MRDDLVSSTSWQTANAALQHTTHKFDWHVILVFGKNRSFYWLKVDKVHCHKLSASRYCTDEFLQSALAALLHPDTKSLAAFSRRLRDMHGSAVHALPTNEQTYLIPLAELLLSMPLVNCAVSNCRRAADKRVIGIDAQFSTLMTVLYQTPHGATSAYDAGGEEESAVRCIHTVRCKDTVLLTRTDFSEHVDRQRRSILEAVGGPFVDQAGESDVELIFLTHHVL